MRRLVTPALWLGSLSLMVSLGAQAFVAWPEDTDIIGNGTSLLARKYEMEPFHVVLQVSDRNPDSWNVTLRNALQLIKAQPDKKPTLEIVAMAYGIEGLKKGSEWADLVKQAQEAGVEIMVCETAMAARHYTHEDMLPDLNYVPLGALEVLHKQKKGYFYLRP